MERVQKRITRHILFKSNALLNIPYEDRLKLLKLDSLEIRRNKLDVIYFSKIIHGEVKIINEKIPKLMTHIRTRNQHKFAYRPFSRLALRRQSFFHRVPKILAKLPISAIKSSPSELKNELKKLPYNALLKY